MGHGILLCVVIPPLLLPTNAPTICPLPHRYCSVRVLPYLPDLTATDTDCFTCRGSPTAYPTTVYYPTSLPCTTPPNRTTYYTRRRHFSCAVDGTVTGRSALRLVADYLAFPAFERLCHREHLPCYYRLTALLLTVIGAPLQFTATLQPPAACRCLRRNVYRLIAHYPATDQFNTAGNVTLFSCCISVPLDCYRSWFTSACSVHSRILPAVCYWDTDTSYRLPPLTPPFLLPFSPAVNVVVVPRRDGVVSLAAVYCSVVCSPLLPTQQPLLPAGFLLIATRLVVFMSSVPARDMRFQLPTNPTFTSDSPSAVYACHPHALRRYTFSTCNAQRTVSDCRALVPHLAVPLRLALYCVLPCYLPSRAIFLPRYCALFCSRKISTTTAHRWDGLQDGTAWNIARFLRENWRTRSDLPDWRTTLQYGTAVSFRW